MQTVPLLHSNLWDIGDPQTVALQSLLKAHSKQTGIKNCPEQKGLLRQIVRNTFTFFVHNCFCNRPLKFVVHIGPRQWGIGLKGYFLLTCFEFSPQRTGIGSLARTMNWSALQSPARGGTRVRDCVI